MTLHSPETIRRWYREILDPTFPDDELVTEQDFVAQVESGWLKVHVEGDPEAPDAVVVGHVHAPSRVMLLDWLAVRPGVRGGGVGRRAFGEALQAWQQEFRPHLMLGEIEHPSLEPADETHGDPRARLRFHGSFGARALPIRYVQPPQRDGERPVPHLMLSVFRVDGAQPGVEIPAAALRDFLAFRFPNDRPPYAEALADVAGESLPTIGLDEDDGRLPNGPRASD